MPLVVEFELQAAAKSPALVTAITHLMSPAVERGCPQAQRPDAQWELRVSRRAMAPSTRGETPLRW